MKTNFKYLQEQVSEKNIDCFPLICEADFNGFEAANHCHKEHQV